MRLKNKEIKSSGLSYTLEDISKEYSPRDLLHMMEQCNQKYDKSHVENANKLREHYRQEVAKDWMLPIPAKIPA